MSERSTIGEQPLGPNGDTEAEQLEDRRLALEQRVRRLEDAVATLQDTGPLEERIVERVSRRLHRAAGSGLEEAGRVFNAGRQLLPAAFDLMRNQGVAGGQGCAPRLAHLPRPWLLLEAYAELRTMVRMFLDPRYRATWPARVLPLALLALILTSWIWLPGTMLLPISIMTVVDKVVDLVLAFLAFKILIREARRYRELVPELPTPSTDR